MFRPIRKYSGVHEKLWLLTFLGADFGHLSSFIHTQKNLHARKYLASVQAEGQASSMPRPQALRRMNSEQAPTEANPRKSQTSNVISPTPAIGVNQPLVRTKEYLRLHMAVESR